MLPFAIDLDLGDGWQAVPTFEGHFDVDADGEIIAIYLDSARQGSDGKFIFEQRHLAHTNPLHALLKPEIERTCEEAIDDHLAPFTRVRSDRDEHCTYWGRP